MLVCTSWMAAAANLGNFRFISATCVKMSCHSHTALLGQVLAGYIFDCVGLLCSEQTCIASSQFSESTGPLGSKAPWSGVLMSDHTSEPSGSKC